MIDLDNLYFCEYSTKLNCFHIAKVPKALQINTNGIMNQFGLDFIPFAVTDSVEKANDLCDQMKKAMQLKGRDSDDSSCE